MHAAPDEGNPTTKVFTLLVEMVCNSYCLFCGQREVDEALIRTRRRLNLTVPSHEIPHKPARYTLESATEALRRARAEGFTVLSLQGGEPTVFPQLPALIANARTLGFTFIGMVTNGRKLEDREYARSLLASGLDGITLSLLGPDAATHDRLSAVDGSFDALCKGLRNAAELSRELSVRVAVSANVIVTALNLDTLPEQVNLLASLGVYSAVLHVVRFNLMAVDPTVRELVRFDPARLPAALARALDAARDAGVRLHTEDVPQCLQPRIDPLEIARLLARSAIEQHRYEAPSFGYEHVRGTRPPEPACNGCLLESACGRIAPEHAGNGESFRPIDVNTLGRDLEDRLARLDTASVEGVAALVAYRDAVAQLARVGDVSAVLARIDEALDDLLVVAFAKRNAAVFAAAMAARLGLQLWNEPLISEEHWDAVLAEASAHLRNGGLWRGDAHTLHVGEHATLLIAGDRERPGCVRVREVIGIRPSATARDARTKTLQRVWLFAAVGIIRQLRAGRSLEIRGDRVRIDRNGQDAAEWARRAEGIALHWT